MKFKLIFDSNARHESLIAYKMNLNADRMNLLKLCSALHAIVWPKSISPSWNPTYIKSHRAFQYPVEFVFIL